ncbi:MAG: MBL fold metallo-hydrolase [Parachlamydia sp.]|nr:MBL fold metallo-hydrolase [Parachlamydia sp.]
MILRQFYTPELAIYSYLVGDRGRAAVIDPTRDVGIYVEAAREARVEIVAILETHVHADFVSGAKELKRALNGKPLIYASQMGGEAWTPQYADHPVSDGDEIRLGALRLRARHTPGHTPEHLIWLCFDETRSSEVPWFLFSGDLLFVGGVGRPDLLGEEAFQTLSRQLYQSLFTKLADLPDYVEIYPAHGAGSLCGKAMSDRTTSTLGYERSFNPSLQPKPEEAWIAALKNQMPAAPRHYQFVKRLNVEGPAAEIATLEEIEKLDSGSFILDTRDPISFAESHLEGAVNIPLAGASFCNWVEMVVPEDRPIVLIVENSQTALELARQFRLMGYNLAGYASWSKVGAFKKASLPLFTPAQVSADPKRMIIDVRMPVEWAAGHIQGAKNVELANLQDFLKEVPVEQPLAMICGMGYRSSLAASLLQSAGFTDVGSVRGGIHAWHVAGLPLTKN